MMYRRHLWAAGITCLLWIWISGCKEDSQPEPVVTSGVSGTVQLTDEFGVDLPESNGMTVAASGIYAGITKADGGYVVDQMVDGSYDLAYQKNGFGTFRRYGVTVVAGGGQTIINGIDRLGQKSTTEVTALGVALVPVDSTYNISCSLAPAPDTLHPRAFRLFFGTSSTVSKDDFTYTPGNTWVATTATGTITGFQRSTLYANGFSPGQTVYLVAYGESIVTNTYTDPVSQHKVYPNLNTASPSNTVQFVLP